MKRLSQEDYIRQCQEIHNNKYDYSLVEYRTISNKISIKCTEHGIFDQIAKNHKEGQGCPRCSGRNETILEFTNKCTKIHNNKYDYSLIDGCIKKRSYIRVIDITTNLVYQQSASHHEIGINPTKIERSSLINRLQEIHSYRYGYIIDKEIVGSTEKIKLIDNQTGDEFLYRVDRHLQGMCPNKVTLNLFKIKSAEVHNNKYDYSLIDKIDGNSNKVDIICPEHGIFNQRVSNHMNLKDGCPICIGKGKWNNDLLISEFRKIHLDKFDYSLVEFKGVSSKIEIICKTHGSFNQNIHQHLKGQGCKLCSSNSKGEEYIKMHLEEMEIKYIQQHGFDTCRYINRLSFDFYLPEYNTCIEFDGIQHFKPIKDFGGEKGFNDCIKRDECKNKWCLENNVKLIRIRYNQIDKINDILNNHLIVDKVKNLNQ